VSTTEPADEELERAWRAGSPAAFDDLFRRHYAGVVGYAMRYVGDLSTAEDLAQQAFLNLLHSRPGSGRFKSLVYTVARNLALNERRRRGRDYAPRGGLDGSEVDRGQAPALGGLVQDEEARAVRAALERLDPEEREAFCLKESEGLTYPEVGRLMGLHPDAVRRRVGRAFAKIRRLLRLDPSPSVEPEREELR
jgi:RNA polymerase sigma-70 factor (ECF subfamily)